MTISTDPEMDTFEERLRQELLWFHEEQFGSHPKLSAGRRRGRRSLVAAGIALLAGCGVAVGLFAGNSAPTPTKTLNATLVVQRTRIAVESTANQIEYVQGTNSDADSGNVQTTSQSWFFGNYGRFDVSMSDGSALMSRVYTPTSSTFYDEQDKEYWQEGPRACTTTATGCTSTFSAAPGYGDFPPLAPVEQQIDNGDFTVSGPMEVSGQQALELSQSDNGATIEIWVDPTTYLPLKSAWTLGWRVQTSLISWLQPTDANMEVFSPPVPAGFTLVPEPTAPAGCPGTQGGQPSGTPPRLSPACKAALAGNTGSAAGNTGSTSSSGS
jgi:hypothetical protein